MIRNIKQLEDLVSKAATRLQKLSVERQELVDEVRSLEGRLEESAAQARSADEHEGGIDREQIVSELRKTLVDLRGE